MAEVIQSPTALGDVAARQLANATKTIPQLATISPRWLTQLLGWVPVEAGIYRLNKVKNPLGADRYTPPGGAGKDRSSCWPLPCN